MKKNKEILEYYKKWGYTRTIEYLRELSLNDKITLTERAELQDMIADTEIQPKRKKRLLP